ncbi:MAG: lysophospholipid acyltransferase family protein [Planctomycetota bacterium]
MRDRLPNEFGQWLATVWAPDFLPFPRPAGLTADELARRQRAFVWRHDPTGKWSRALRKALGYHALAAVRAMFAGGAPPRGVLDALAMLAVRMPGRRRRVAHENLLRAFPEQSPEWRDAVWRRFLRTALDVLVQVLSLETDPPQRMRERVIIDGESHLREALAAGRGAICLTAHFAAFPMTFTRLALDGWPSAVLIKRQRDPVFEQWWKHLRDRSGTVSIPDLPPLASARMSLAWLRAGGVICMAGDQRAPGDAPLIPFFGHDVHTYPLPARLALRTGAAILPTLVDPPGPDGRQVMRIHPPLQPAVGAPADVVVRKLLADFHRVLEAEIRREPHAWWWVHNRFHRWTTA